jgi:hypothetical protein
MAGGGQVATASQPPSSPSGDTYGGILNNRMSPPQQQFPPQYQPQYQSQYQPQFQPEQQLMGVQQQYNFEPKPDESGFISEVGRPDFERNRQIAQQQFPVGAPYRGDGIAGLQNNLPPSMQGGMGGLSQGQDVIVHGRPIGQQSGSPVESLA